MKFFLDLSDGGAWPFLVGEVICLLNCVNERDLCLLIGGGDDFKQLWDGEGVSAWIRSFCCESAVKLLRGTVYVPVHGR